jgi:2-hydroxychromene-2-carboxylate isomerase
MADDAILAEVLDKAGYNGQDLVKKASAPDVKARLRELTAEAKDAGVCGVPSYRVFKQSSSGGGWENVGGIVWGQDETNVVEDLIAGWDNEHPRLIAEPVKGKSTSLVAKL